MVEHHCVQSLVLGSVGKITQTGYEKYIHLFLVTFVKIGTDTCDLEYLPSGIAIKVINIIYHPVSTK